MKVTGNPKKTIVTVDNMASGTCFYCNGSTFLRVRSASGANGMETNGVVNLENGAFYNVNQWTGVTVTPVEVEARIL